MLGLIREHRWFFLGTALAGLALRLFFFAYFPMVADDSRVYANIATNWLQHGVYGETQLTQILPTDARLPGYPAFLAAIFWLFGIGRIRAVLLVQIAFDLATCFVVADLARRVAGERAGKIAFLLTALCPFLANYAAAELTETLEVFFTTLALDCTMAALNRINHREEGARRLWVATGAALAACILLRPDGGILLAAVVFYLIVSAPKGAFDLTDAVSLKRYSDTDLESSNLESRRQRSGGNPRGTLWKPGAEVMFFRVFLVAAIIVTVVALAPLGPWAMRNFQTLHHFQPLAPRYATETDELVLRGFNRWVKTWMADYVSVEEIYWLVPGDKIDPQKLPARAFDSPAEKAATLDLIADYNQSQDMTPDLDARLGKLAADRISAHPIRYYAVLPLLRVADMWLRPRTEILPPDPRWWQFNDETKQSAMAVGFGLLNLAYLAAAMLSVVFACLHKQPKIRWVGLLITFVVLRSAFLGTLENPESRYTLECYPVIIVLASAWLAGRCGRTQQSL